MLEPASPLVSLMLKTRIVRIVGRRLIGTYLALLPDGSRMLVRSRSETDEEVVNEVFGKRIYDRPLPMCEGMRVVDIGANIGAFSVKAARAVGAEGNVLAIEPELSNFRIIVRNLQVNHLKNVDAHNVALGGAAGERILNIYERQGDHSFYERPGRKVGIQRVETETLDRLLEGMRWKPDFIKLDSEGAGLEILRGAELTLASAHPAIAMETRSFGGSRDEIVALLDRHGYDIQSEKYGKEVGLLYAT